jgi:hypothetical protein
MQYIDFVETGSTSWTDFIVVRYVETFYLFSEVTQSRSTVHVYVKVLQRLAPTFQNVDSGVILTGKFFIQKCP